MELIEAFLEKTVPKLDILDNPETKSGTAININLQMTLPRPTQTYTDIAFFSMDVVIRKQDNNGYFVNINIPGVLDIKGGVTGRIAVHGMLSNAFSHYIQNAKNVGCDLTELREQLNVPKP